MKLELLDSALILLSAEPVTQANQKRAISAIYYALFHAAMELCANEIAGNEEASLQQSLWLNVYRSLDHGQTKKRCIDIEKQSHFTPCGSVVAFATHLSHMHAQREKADYHPLYRADVKEVALMHVLAMDAIHALDKAPPEQRRLFALYLLFPGRK